MPVPPPAKPRPSEPPVDPVPWLERTEALVDGYRRALALARSKTDLGLGFIWIAADHIFECQGTRADFALLDVMKLMTDCHSLLAGKSGPFIQSLSGFYAYLGAERLIEPGRAAEIRAQLLRQLEPT